MLISVGGTHAKLENKNAAPFMLYSDCIMYTRVCPRVGKPNTSRRTNNDA